MRKVYLDHGRRIGWTQILVLGLALIAIVAATTLAPAEKTMGSIQRILYLHVPVAWLGLLGFMVMAATGAVYLLRRDFEWDHWAQSAAELGWLCCGLTLVTGSVWARSAWGTWWTWDPRLTAAGVLWLIYSGCLIARANVPDPHGRARLGAVLAIIGMLDVPLVVMATRWFRGMHPVSPEMDPRMRAALAVSFVGFTALFAVLVMRRRDQLRSAGMSARASGETTCSFLEGASQHAEAIGATGAANRIA
jgi:heme exporter protein C